MKKRVIALSVAAALGGFAGAASAQNASNDLVFAARGTGHILYVPYYSVQGGNTTLINIVNTDQVNGKAVKVRFRGASNSDDVFDFQLFLSPGDVWTANISQGGGGVPALSTSDKSCTLPANVNQSFILGRLNQALTGDALANEAREGYVEIFNMGDVHPTYWNGTSNVANPLFTAIKHVSGVAPCTTATLEGLTRFDSKISDPTRGLMGNWTIINVPQTTTWTGDMAAIVAVDSNGDPGYGNQVFFPQTAVALTSDDVSSYTADPLFKGATPIVAGASYDLPDLSTPYCASCPIGTPQSQANILSHAISSRVLAGEYLTSSSIGASTDWIVSFPTRRYYVAVDYVEEELVTNFDYWGVSDAVYFREKGGNDGTSGNVVLRGYQACVTLDAVKFYNREEGTPQQSGIVISPGVPAPAPELCGEVSAVSINAGGASGPSPTIKASVARANVDIGSGFVDGWGQVTANNTVGSGNWSGLNLGLPQITAQFARAFNPAASAGFSGTFAARWSARTLQAGQDPMPLYPPIQ